MRDDRQVAGRGPPKTGAHCGLFVLTVRLCVVCFAFSRTLLFRQSKLGKSEDPSVTVKELSAKAAALEKFAKHIMTKAKVRVALSLVFYLRSCPPVLISPTSHHPITIPLLVRSPSPSPSPRRRHPKKSLNRTPIYPPTQMLLPPRRKQALSPLRWRIWTDPYIHWGGYSVAPQAGFHFCNNKSCWQSEGVVIWLS
jgi:hypothetical protein